MTERIYNRVWQPDGDPDTPSHNTIFRISNEEEEEKLLSVSRNLSYGEEAVVAVASPLCCPTNIRSAKLKEEFNCYLTGSSINEFPEPIEEEEDV